MGDASADAALCKIKNCVYKKVPKGFPSGLFICSLFLSYERKDYYKESEEVDERDKE